MEFCHYCGSLLIPQKVKTANTNSVKLVCRRCGRKKEAATANVEPTMYRVIQHTPQQRVAVIGKEVQLDTLPTINVECPNCGNNKTYIWLVQTRGSKESSTQFMRCTKCNYTYREYT